MPTVAELCMNADFYSTGTSNINVDFIRLLAASKCLAVDEREEMRMRERGGLDPKIYDNRSPSLLLSVIPVS